MITELKISQKDIDLIHSELDSNKPYEACGVLAGRIRGSTASRTARRDFAAAPDL